MPEEESGQVEVGHDQGQALAGHAGAEIVQGRPAYDDIALVNGARVDTRPPDEERTCRPPTRITQRTVEAVPAESEEAN